MDEINVYSRVHVHATQKRELAGRELREAVFKIVVRREAYQNERIPIKLKPF